MDHSILIFNDQIYSVFSVFRLIILSQILESFWINLQNQKEVKEERVFSFVAPKLTKEELKLVQEQNEQHLKTYLEPNPHVDVEEMKKI